MKKYFKRLIEVVKFLLMALVSLIICLMFVYTIVKSSFVLRIIFGIVFILPIYILIRLTIWSIIEASRSLKRDESIFDSYYED